jgi:hypothetical protein
MSKSTINIYSFIIFILQMDNKSTQSIVNDGWLPKLRILSNGPLYNIVANSGLLSNELDILWDGCYNKDLLIIIDNN